jgi:hypothetical protein
MVVGVLAKAICEFTIRIMVKRYLISFFNDTWVTRFLGKPPLPPQTRLFE